MKVAVGQIVHYVIKEGEHRPAIIVAVWPNEFPGNADHPEGVNLQVFIDGRNDWAYIDEVSDKQIHAINMSVWITSAEYSNLHQVGTWHWPEHEE